MSDTIPLRTVIREDVTCPACNGEDVRCYGRSRGRGYYYYRCLRCPGNLPKGGGLRFRVRFQKIFSAPLNNLIDAEQRTGHAGVSELRVSHAQPPGRSIRGLPTRVEQPGSSAGIKGNAGHSEHAVVQDPVDL
ncbi:MAG TPA: hypothetical protein VEA41_21245 [Salinarimonas sp.]|nr:hypothetical protein [Salinarimonas sp.]